MTSQVSIEIPGRPQPKARPRAERRGLGLHIYTPTSAAEKQASGYMMKHRGKLKHVDEVIVSLIFYGPHHAADIDNLAKLYLDALVKADVFGDDRKVAALWVQRRKVEKGGQPRTLIYISEWKPES